MKGILLFLIFFCLVSESMAAHVLADKIKPYLLEPETKKKKGNRNNDEKTKPYEKEIESVSYIALYFSNSILDQKFQKKLTAVTDYYTNLKEDDRYKDQEIPGNIEFVYIITGVATSKKEQEFKFPYIDAENTKKLSSATRFAPRNGPGLVVVSSSGQIIYRGQPENVIKALEELIPVEKKQK